MNTETNVSTTEVQDMHPLMYEYKRDTNTFILTYRNGVTIETSSPALPEDIIEMYKAKLKE